ncbi:DNA polymerase delta subunit 1 [Nematocida ausubeli]|nr:DNA polymerase delta subunit 1 [Nematocida ausubeli]
MNELASVTFLPLHIYYTVEDAGPLVCLQGKTQAGEEIECTVSGHYHYFYISKVPGESIDSARIEAVHKEIVKVNVVTKTNIYGYAEGEEEFYQICIRDPKKIVSVSTAVVEYFSRMDENKNSRITFEVNIGYIIRFMVDKEIVGMGYVNAFPTKREVKNGKTFLTVESTRIFPIKTIDKLPPIKILSLDIECIGENNKFPIPTRDPVVQIGNAVAVYPNPEIVEKVLFCTKTTNPIPGASIFSFNDEKEMLTAWSQWVSVLNPDVLTGYNITQFDMPYLLDRANTLGLPDFKYFSRTKEPVHMNKLPQTNNTGSNNGGNNNGKEGGNNNGKEGDDKNGSSGGFTAPATLVVPGRIVFDMLDIVKKEFNLHSYSLNSVSSVFLGEQKEDVHYTQILALYNGTDETRKRLGVYCLKDTYLPIRIMYTKNLFINYCELARVTGVPFEYLVNRGQGIRVLSQLLRQAKAYNYILPVVIGQNETYEGGYVMEPNKGFYSNPVVVLDYASLYPSIIMAYNMCYTTLLSKEQASKMDKSEYTESPTGDCFLRKEKKPGILPVILTGLLEGRKAVRAELKNIKDPELKASLNARQLALKVSANSVYGFTGAARTGLPCIPISRSVTGFGREILKKTKELVENEYNKGEKTEGSDQQENNNSQKEGNRRTWNLFVAYGDTDSVMVTQPGLTLEQAFQVGDEISKFVSTRLPNPLTLEFEKVYHPFVLINKKRYAGCTKTSPSDKGRIDTKGIETVRRDNCLLVRDLMKECINKVFLEGDVEGTRALIKDRVKELLSNRIGISQLIITKSITKQGGDYAVSLAHVALAERMKKREGTGPGLGDRVPYVIITGKGPLHERSEDPVYALNNNLPIDTLYYLKNQITKPLERLLSYVIKDILTILAPPDNYTVGAGMAVREMPKGIGAFFKKKKTCVICKAGDYPVCKVCDKSYPAVILETYQKLCGLQCAYHLVMRECQEMQNARHSPIVCSNRDCPVYYIRIELQKEIEEVQGRYTQLLEHKQKIPYTKE